MWQEIVVQTCQQCDKHLLTLTTKLTLHVLLNGEDMIKDTPKEVILRGKYTNKDKHNSSNFLSICRRTRNRWQPCSSMMIDNNLRELQEIEKKREISLCLQGRDCITTRRVDRPYKSELFLDTKEMSFQGIINVFSCLLHDRRKGKSHVRKRQAMICGRCISQISIGGKLCQLLNHCKHNTAITAYYSCSLCPAVSIDLAMISQRSL